MKKHIFMFCILAMAFIAPSVFAQTVADPVAEEETAMLENPQYFLDKARQYYVSAQTEYQEGEYDKSADDSAKARDYAEKYRKSVQLSASYKMSLAKIKEAEDLIAQAKTLKATDADLQPSVDKLNEAKQFLTEKNYPLASNSADESITLTKDLINRLKSMTTVKEGNENKFWKTYKVRFIPEKRDCLWRIAEYDYIYKNPWKWPLIWKANKDQIVDPDLIYPGQVFNIPKIEEDKPGSVPIQENK